MPLESDHLLEFLLNANKKYSSELLNLLIERVNELCFEQCQIDRIQCTLTPLCTRRFLIKLRIKNGLPIEDLPKFCYSVLKNEITRDFRNKTVVYKPFDAYLYLIDFLDVFFHGDYRKLNKYLSFKNWEDALEIFDNRIYKRKENFSYHISDQKNYIIFKFGDRIHVVYINKNYVLCNANREKVKDLTILKALIELYNKLYFPDIESDNENDEYVFIRLIVPKDVISRIPSYENKNDDLLIDSYFHEKFPQDLDKIMSTCSEIHLEINGFGSLIIELQFSLETNFLTEEGEYRNLRYRDMRNVLNFVRRIYNDFYVYWLK